MPHGPRGLELESVEAHDTTVYRSNDGATYDVSEVLGSGGTSYAGDRTYAAAFAEMSLPLAENLDLRVAGRGDDVDDVGRNGVLALRGRLPDERHRHAARLLERGRQGAPPAVSPCLRAAGPSLRRLRPGDGKPAPLLHGTQPPGR